MHNSNYWHVLYIVITNDIVMQYLFSINYLNIPGAVDGFDNLQDAIPHDPLTLLSSNGYGGMVMSQ